MEARYFDGQTASPQIVAVAHDAETDALLVRAADAPNPIIWRLNAIRVIDEHGERIAFGTMDDPAARLVIDRRDFAWYRSVCPDLYRASATAQAGRRLVALVIGAAISLILVIVAVIPYLAHEIAPLIPRPVQVRIGNEIQEVLQTLAVQPGKKSAYCVGTKDARLALKSLAARLAAAARIDPPTILVMRSSVPNAFALPPNKVIVLSGLIEQLPSEAAFAAVLGHEFGHLAHHDPMEMLIEGSGIGIVIALFTGDLAGTSIVAAGAGTLVESSFSREREDAADHSAIDTLIAVGISPRDAAPLFDIFTSLEKKYGGIPVFLSRHPDTGHRKALFESAALPRPQPLPPAEWRDLQAFTGTGGNCE